MKVKQSMLAGAVIATVALGGGGLAMAATDTSGANATSASLVERIAAKFNLSQADVQAEFDAARTEMKADREAEHEERLAQAVKDGSLTQEQSDYIAKAQEEIQALRGDKPMRDLDDSARDQIREKMEALHTWAEENNVDLKDVMGGGRGSHGGGGFGGQHR